MLKIIIWILAFLLFVGVAIFVIPNIESTVTLYYYMGTIETNLVFLLVTAIFIGAILGILFNLTWVWHLRSNNRQLRNLHKQALKEIENLLNYSK